MFRAIPMPNKNCVNFTNEQNRKLHLKKVIEMRPFVNTSPPNSFGIVNSRKKKEQLMEDRFTEIERENRILLEKITNIMQKNPQLNNFRKTPNILLKKTSLNQNVRKRDLVKIAIENQEIFKRLENKRSAYNIKLWQKNREISVKYLANISEYPLLRNSSEFERTQIKTENINKRTKKWCYTTNTGFGEFNKDSENEKKPSTSFNKNRKIVIYKKSRVIRQRKFLIEIFIDKQVFTIIAEDIDQPFINILEIPEFEAIEFLRRNYRSNIENLLNNIEKTQDNSLVLASTGYVFEKRKLRGIEPERKNSFEKDVFQKPSNEKKGTESELYKEEVDKSSNQEIIYENSTIIKKIEDPMEIKQEFDKNELKMNDISEKNLSEKENNKEEVIESPTNKGN